LLRQTLEGVIAVVLLLVLSPLLLMFAIGAAVSTRAWPLFTQVRVGLDGKPFRLVKLRTLPKSTPSDATKYELGQLPPPPRLCQAMRAYHLDELPQLLLVVTGRMRLVGPRPEMPHLYTLFSDEFARLRTSVKPGCTGLWQISHHCKAMIFEHTELDEYYVQHHNLWLDGWILARTGRFMLPIQDRRIMSVADIPSWIGVEVDATRARELATSEANGLAGKSS